ncbi:MAG: YgjP-like metallopeptidase domain-containing protein [bacterium]
MNYTLIRARKRTLSLQVTRAGEVIARAPLYYPKFLIDRFVESKSRWITKRRAELMRPLTPPATHFTPNELQDFIRQQVSHYGAIMHLTPHSLRFTRVHSYWGTCSPTGVLSFNLALCTIPPEAVTYVVVHELAHLRWKGHGHSFWKMVTQYYPHTQEMRKLLRSLPRSI